jgi:beta-glucanase (GH16 family)
VISGILKKYLKPMKRRTSVRNTRPLFFRLTDNRLSIGLTLLFSGILIFAYSITVSGKVYHTVQQLPVSNYVLFWRDEFSGNKLNRDKWGYMTGARRDAYNSRETVFLDGKGFLHLQAKEKADSILTAMISTEGLFETRYGYFECRAKLTNALGIWPAFWLLSGKMAADNGTPDTHGAEIDVFEYFANYKRDSVSHNIHWGGYGRNHQEAGPVYAPLKKTENGFHTFGLEWTDTSYRAFVDGQQTVASNRLISKVEQFIILSVECAKDAAGPLDKNGLPDDFIVDYVRVYKRAGK